MYAMRSTFTKFNSFAVKVFTQVKVLYSKCLLNVKLPDTDLFSCNVEFDDLLIASNVEHLIIVDQ